MKFEEMFLGSKSDDRFEYEGSQLVKCRGMGVCSGCGAVTRWLDMESQSNVCSEECFRRRGKRRLPTVYEHLADNAAYVRDEMDAMTAVRPASKDIIVVVHNQLNYVKECLESIRQFTTDYNLYVWDNASDNDTVAYLQSQLGRGNMEMMRSESNVGFIKPNNELVDWGSGEYIILLNSDCVVSQGWWQLLVGFLQKHPEVAMAGGMGGILAEDGVGRGSASGYDIDYIHGYCMAFRRETYEQYGLFNKQLRFAYGEDSDFSLRLKEAGEKIYALYTPLVYHYGNATIKEVKREGKIDVSETLQMNHAYIRLRWKDYLQKHRMELKAKKDEQVQPLVGSVVRHSGDD